MTFVYWRRPSGSLSRLHRTHPDHARYTWCGAIREQGRADVSEVFYLAAQPRGVELCEQCQSSKPIRLNIREETEEVAA